VAEAHGEWLYGLPLPFLAGVGCLSLLPTTPARRAWLSLLLVVVLAVPLAYVGAYLVLWFGPGMPMSERPRSPTRGARPAARVL
jgi:hypothetical protein